MNREQLEELKKNALLMVPPLRLLLLAMALFSAWLLLACGGKKS